MPSCPHERRSFFRHVFRRTDGSEGYHVAEHCHVCGVNVRGAGVWASKDEAGDVNALPEWRGQKDEQPTLF